MPTTHKVKSWEHLYRPLAAGLKTHDLRLNDRRYEVGDTLHAQEYDALNPHGPRYTGRELKATITYITGSTGLDATPCAVSTAVLPKDYVILSVMVTEIFDRTTGMWVRTSNA